MSSCIACREAVSELRNFGSQPLTNRFPGNPHEAVCAHPLVLAQCGRCGLVQLTNPVSPNVLRPPRPMFYQEPEGHLDALVAEIIALPGISQQSRVCGVTYKEETTLTRLERLGYHNLTLFSAESFGIEDECAGLETIQAAMTPDLTARLVEQHGAFDVVIVRHLLEHAHDLTQFLAAVKQLACPEGYLVFEVPDSSTLLEVADYSFLWEEHVTYFTPATVAATLAHHHVPPQRVLTYPYPLENSLIAIANGGIDETAQTVSTVPDLRTTSGEIARGQRFADSFDHVREEWQKALVDLRGEGPIALLGAGHLAVAFINLLGLHELIDYVCDDSPDKVDRWLPGTRLRISSSETLLQHPIKLCLMAVAPESEPKVLARNPAFLARGGRFASIFRASSQALPLPSAATSES